MLAYRAPFFSFLLAIGNLGGLDPFEGARWMNAIIFGLNIFLVGFLLSHHAHTVAGSSYDVRHLLRRDGKTRRFTLMMSLPRDGHALSRETE